MAFPLTHRGKMEFVLSDDPDAVTERFYADAAVKIERSLAVDASVEISACDKKLIVSYTLTFKKLLVIVSVFIPVMFGIYFALWDTASPPGLPLNWNRSGLRKHPSVTHLVAAMSFMWLWFFGGVYCFLVARFRSLLRDTWKELNSLKPAK